MNVSDALALVENPCFFKDSADGDDLRHKMVAWVLRGEGCFYDILETAYGRAKRARSRETMLDFITGDTQSEDGAYRIAVAALHDRAATVRCSAIAACAYSLRSELVEMLRDNARSAHGLERDFSCRANRCDREPQP
jgi:hypothetical protein